jgi:PadR family transcriptional regulator, regulatory protein PadR
MTTGSRRPSPQSAAVLAALAAQPTTWRHGYELAAETGLKSGSLYPILIRLADQHLLEAQWEPDPPRGRPARHLYRLTEAGLELAARTAVAPSAMRATRANPRQVWST